MQLLMMLLVIVPLATPPAEKPMIEAPSFLIAYQGDECKVNVSLKNVTTVTSWAIAQTASAGPPLALEYTTGDHKDNIVKGTLLLPKTTSFKNADGAPTQLKYTITATFPETEKLTQATADIYIEIHPFDIARHTQAPENAAEASTYKTINLMTFLLDQMPTKTLFSTKIADLAAGLANPANPRGIQAAITSGLLLPAEGNAVLGSIRLLLLERDPASFLQKEVRYLYEENRRNNNTEVFFTHFDVISKSLALPFMTAFDDMEDELKNPRPKPNAAFVDTYVKDVKDGGVGDLTELDIYRKPAKGFSSAVRTTLHSAKKNGVFVPKRDTSKARLSEGDGTKDNSKVCGQIWNGSTWVDTCITCSNPQRQSFCAIVNGECTLASDPGPCTNWPEVR